MKVAILGTGKMGGAMARRLNSQGHDLTLWNRTRERAEAIGVGKGCSPNTPLAAATRELYERAAQSAGDLDLSAIATLYDKQPARRNSGQT
jgi:predicted dinucleotide-binding enzyme